MDEQRKPRDLTPERALMRARLLWGRNAKIRDCGANAPRYRVGELVRGPLGWMFMVRGRGESWAAAFRDAERDATPTPGGSDG